jgi:lipopolysaccharide export system protein LptC
MTDTAVPSAPGSFVATGPTDKTQAFRVAKRHTRHVRLMRWLIVTTAVGLIGGVAVFAIFDPLGRIPAGVSVQSIGVEGTKVMMARPKLAGFRNDGRPYEIMASSAVQDLKVPTIFTLHDMDAHLTMSDKAVTHVTASIGTYDSTKEIMNLTSEVHISSDSGLDMKASDARVEFKSGSVVTDNPVNVAMRGSTITADTMRMSDGFKRVTFLGHVQTVFIPQNEDSPASGVRPDGSGSTAPAPADPASGTP